MSLWNRGEPVLEPHPAQLELLDVKQRVDTAVTAIDDALRRVKNGRPDLRDELLSLRHVLAPARPS